MTVNTTDTSSCIWVSIRFDAGCVFVFWMGIVCWYGNTRRKVCLDCWSSSGLEAKSWRSLSEQLPAQMTTPAPCKWRKLSYSNDINCRHSEFMSRLAGIGYHILLKLEFLVFFWSRLCYPWCCVRTPSTQVTTQLRGALPLGGLYFHTFSTPLPSQKETFT